MDELSLYHKFTRKEVHDYFVPNGKFTPNAGTWGLHGWVKIQNTDSDYVFFVTYGQSQGDHIFQEGISKDGILTWQSQPKQHLNERHILTWINQIKGKNKIHLFVRSKKEGPYTFFGEIEYQSHDFYREYPVWFEFRIVSWMPNTGVVREFVRETTRGLSTAPSFDLVGSPKKQSVKKIKTEYKLNAYDKHLRDLLTNNQDLLDIGEGYRWEFDYEFDLGDTADLVFFWPGREVKIVSICSQESEISYLKAIKAKLWRSQICFEREEEESSEFIQAYLISKSISDHTKQFCQKYGVSVLKV